MPFAWICDVLAWPGIARHEAVAVGAQGPGIIRDCAHLDQLLERLKVTDMALQSAIPSPHASANAQKSAQQQEYLVPFWSKCSMNLAAGVPHTLQGISGHRSALAQCLWESSVHPNAADCVPEAATEPFIPVIFDTAVDK
jgi:hypothetical protein